MNITKEQVDNFANQIKVWFDDLGNGRGCKAVIGISGGKDSTVAAALCVKALGKDRVFGVLMPNGEQSDIDDSYRVCEELDINYVNCNIKDAYDAVIKQMNEVEVEPSAQTKTNIPPRLRMTMLYAISQSVNGRVINTSNFSEYMLGYCTQWGDNVGDLAVLRSFTKTEVVQIGEILGISDELIHKAPADGLTGLTDEDKFGFTYEDLDKYLENINDESIDNHTKVEIIEKIRNSHFKRQPMHVIG